MLQCISRVLMPMLLFPAFVLADGVNSSSLSITEYAIERGGVPRDPYVAKNGHVWFCGQGGNYLGRLNPQTQLVDYFELRAGSHPHNLIVSDEGKVWYAGNRNGHIGVLDPSTGKVEEIAMPEGVKDPHTLVFDAQQNIWFTAQNSNVIGFLDVAQRSVKIFPVKTPKARPYGIKLAPDGNVWVVLLGTNKLLKVDVASEQLQEIELPFSDARPRRLEVTEEGNVWYADYSRGRLGLYSPQSKVHADWLMPGGAQSKPYATVLDHRRIIWISETGTYPNALVGFDTNSKAFVSSQKVTADGSIRHMYFDENQKQFWFGIDNGVIASAKPSP